MSATELPAQHFPVIQIITQARGGSPMLWNSALALVLLALACLALSQFDTRLFNGVSTWDKPAKFFVSVAVQFATVAFAMGYLAKSRSVAVAAWVLFLCGWIEDFYIVYRAALAEASHFNAASTFGIIAYALMGVGAVAMTASSGFIGWKVWRARQGVLMREAIGLGLMVCFVLGTWAGMVIGGHGSHFWGGEMNDAHGLGLFGWSTTGGDVRPAHFIGLHAAQIIPFAALSKDRRVVYGVAMVLAIATAGLLTIGVSGVPLLRN